jgi:phage tail-like protein
MPEQYPVPGFNFTVVWGGARIAFSEVTGLNAEVQVIEYRHGDSRSLSGVKMAGLKKYGNITLKRGVFANDNDYQKWMQEIYVEDPWRRDLTITLLNEKREETMTWEVSAAWPTKITSPDLKGSGNEVAIESIEIAHEGVEIVNG